MGKYASRRRVFYIVSGVWFVVANLLSFALWKVDLSGPAYDQVKFEPDSEGQPPTRHSAPVIIQMDLWTNPSGRRGGADFEVECLPGIGTLSLVYDKAKFPPVTHEAIAELCRGLECYAAQPDDERGALPSAIFHVTKIHGDTTAADLSVYRTAGVFAASNFHKRVHAQTSET